jgi:hypothetical protein
MWRSVLRPRYRARPAHARRSVAFDHRPGCLAWLPGLPPRWRAVRCAGGGGRPGGPAPLGRRGRSSPPRPRSRCAPVDAPIDAAPSRPLLAHVYEPALDAASMPSTAVPRTDTYPARRTAATVERSIPRPSRREPFPEGPYRRIGTLPHGRIPNLDLDRDADQTRRQYVIPAATNRPHHASQNDRASKGSIQILDAR